MMLMMSDLDLIRGCPWPRIPWWMQMRSRLPRSWGGMPLYWQVEQAALFADQRDWLEFLVIQLMRSHARPGKVAQAMDLIRRIRLLRWKMSCEGWSPGDLQFRPGIAQALRQCMQYSAQLTGLPAPIDL